MSCQWRAGGCITPVPLVLHRCVAHIRTLLAQFRCALCLRSCVRPVRSDVINLASQRPPLSANLAHICCAAPALVLRLPAHTTHFPHPGPRMQLNISHLDPMPVYCYEEYCYLMCADASRLQCTSSPSFGFFLSASNKRLVLGYPHNIVQHKLHHKRSCILTLFPSTYSAFLANIQSIY